jgi:hypothetical protein
VQYLDSFCVLLIKGANVEGIGGIHLPAWGNQWGRVLCKQGSSVNTGEGLQGAPSRPTVTLTFCKKTICQSRERKKGLSFTS